jgi:hypothetical protein
MTLSVNKYSLRFAIAQLLRLLLQIAQLLSVSSIKVSDDGTYGTAVAQWESALGRSLSSSKKLTLLNIPCL